jgi:uncharacterized protein YcnI
MNVSKNTSNGVKKYIALIFTLSLLLAQSAFAHVGVKPNKAGIGAYQVFTVGVPSEKDSATTMVRLVIPEGLESVSPNVKTGWNIELKKDADKVTEIVWRGGSIPAHFRDEFLFSAKVPAQETALNWKAYQTYKNGETVSWDLGPNQEQPKTAEGKSDFSKSGPYSTTEVVDDLKPVSVPLSSRPQVSFVLSLVAVAIALVSLIIWFSKKRR